ncbi:MAG: cell division protein ZipA [Gammaproteobacteria bacterium]|nr:cell division protein ZipA [Gammaproteobacteria bacterium]MDH5729955.1 cell division protein ZipA [Gammaproteobacteria bacterium]
MNDILSFLLDPIVTGGIAIIIVLLIAFLFFSFRPKINEQAFLPENRATHPSEYQGTETVDVGQVKIKTVYVDPQAYCREEDKILNPDVIDHDEKNADSIEEELAEIKVSNDLRGSLEEVIKRNHEQQAEESKVTNTSIAENSDDIVPTETQEDDSMAKSDRKKIKRTKVNGKLKAGNSRVIILHLKGDDEQRFTGKALMAALKITGFEYGEQNIFHFPAHRELNQVPQFSIANITEPGVFEIDNMGSFETKGISLFMVIPQAERDPIDVYSEMVATAHTLRKILGGCLFDENFERLTNETVARIKQEIMGFCQQQSLELTHSA